MERLDGRVLYRSRGKFRVLIDANVDQTFKLKHVSLRRLPSWRRRVLFFPWVCWAERKSPPALTGGSTAGCITAVGWSARPSCWAPPRDRGSLSFLGFPSRKNKKPYEPIPARKWVPRKKWRRSRGLFHIHSIIMRRKVELMPAAVVVAIDRPALSCGRMRLWRFIRDSCPLLLRCKGTHPLNHPIKRGSDGVTFRNWKETWECFDDPTVVACEKLGSKKQERDCHWK